MRRRGLTTGEVLVALMVVVAFIAIVIPIYLNAQKRTYQDADIRQMRSVYLAWSLYQADFSGVPSPTLQTLIPRLTSPQLLQSSQDPYLSGGPFPTDPMLPSFEVTSEIRVSYTYLPNFVRNGKAQIRSWDEYLLDPRGGLIASVWQGSADPSPEPFRATLRGSISRINTDGSAVTISNPKAPIYENPESLFFQRP